MSRLLYYLVLKPLSYLPLRVLYLLADFIFFFVYHVVAYRKAVVYKNLENSFPNKTAEEIKILQKGFFEHFCDLIVENIKLFSMSRQEVQKRFKIVNTEIFDDFYDQGRSIVLVGGHYNNWEIAAKGFDLCSPHQAIGIYSPLRDKFFEKKQGESRSKYGVEIIPKHQVPRSFVANKDRLTMTIFGADQSPTYSKQVHWMTFLNQETAVHVGTEVFAAKYNYPVVFIKINKVKRGFYEGVLEVLNENPASSKQGEITELHTRSLEKTIIEKPQFWLWSHKRWKRKRTEEERLAKAV
jgi:KDO2-lipid IV(A) lauroyltransferase